MRGVAVLAGGTAIGQAMMVLASPLLSRLYTPQDFGIFALFTSFLGIMGTMATLKYDMAIPLPKNDETAVSLVMLSLGVVIFESILLLFGIPLSGEFICQATNTTLLLPYLFLLPIGLLGIGCYDIFSHWSIREKRYTIISRTKIVQSLGNVLAQTLFGLLALGPIGLMIGYIIGQTSGVASLGMHFFKRYKKNSIKISGSRLLRTASRYQKFPIFMSGSALLNQAGFQAPCLLLASLYSLEAAGWFFLTQKVLSAPVQLIGKSVSQVFMGEAAQMITENPRRMLRLFRRLSLKLFLIGMPACVVLSIWGKFLFTAAFGGQWVMSGVFVQVMSPFILAKFAGDSISVLPMLQRQELLIVWNLLRLFLILSGLSVAVMLGFSEVAAVVFFSMAMVVCYVVKYILVVSAIKKKIADHSDAVIEGNVI